MIHTGKNNTSELFLARKTIKNVEIDIGCGCGCGQNKRRRRSEKTACHVANLFETVT